MATRRNLALTPAAAVDSTYWFGPGDWARSTSLHASHPRTTGFAGTSTGDMQPSRALGSVAGKYVVCSVSFRGVSANSVRLNIDYYSAGVFIPPSSSGTETGFAGGVTDRLVSGVGLAPLGTDRIQPNVRSLDASAQVTAVWIEVFDTEEEAEAALADHADPLRYFDGDGAGTAWGSGASAAWDGDAGESTSTLTYDDPVVLSAELASPAASITVSRTVAATLTANLAPPLAAIGLFTTVSYDDRRGRIRIRVSGLAATVVRIVVSSRANSRGRWRQVRGGKVAVVGGEPVRVVDDYEFTADGPMQYRIEGYSTQEGETDQIVQSRLLRVDAITPQVWIKFIAAPYRNKRVKLIGWSQVSRKARVSVYDVAGRRDRVAVTDVHTGREITVQVVTYTVTDRDSLDESLGTGAPVFFQTPDTITCPTMYAAIGDFEWERTAPRSERSVFTIRLLEVAPPPPSVVGAGLTYTVLTGLYADYAELAELVDTYAATSG